MTHRSAGARARHFLTAETTGGALLIGAAILALVWANSPWSQAYTSLSEFTLGPAAWHLDLPLSVWAADGLLAIFFFTVGLELKHEFVAGSLRNPKEAGVPMLAAVGGMLVPAGVYLLVINLAGDPGAAHGWAVPTATDIAFALAILAVFGRGLPTAIRTFLLTLAVVDDLLAIIVIAVAYTSDLKIVPLLLALVGVVAFTVLVRVRRVPWIVLVPLALTVWVLVHESGVHATVAGVLLGFAVPARPMHGEAVARAVRYEHGVRPFSSAFALPMFAFFAAGVSVSSGLGATLTSPVAVSIITALVVGKLIGVMGTTAVVTRFTALRLAPGLGIRDLLPVGFLTGIGFTVALLLAELSFTDEELVADAKTAVLAASVLAAFFGALALRWDAHRARRADMNDDGVPDEVTELIGDEE